MAKTNGGHAVNARPRFYPPSSSHILSFYVPLPQNGITMLNGHGDDSYRYGRKITLNFSSNVYHHTSLAPLFRHLENCWEQVRSYPEPSPHAVESQLAQAMGISAESICLTSGATEAIYLIAQTFPDGVPASCPPRFRNTRMPAACTAIRYGPSIPPTICRRMRTSCGSAIRTTRPGPSFPTTR